ncbi:tripeptidyl-peptidase 1 [Xylariaceae sp. FL1019]|nr:tripeptidyl-peptidase 1 [Xylariaceae sp. FL1019]
MRSLATTLFATAATARLMDSLPSVPRGWTQVGEAALTEPISLKIALPQQHSAALEQAVLEMSTPSHPNYGKHMSRLELRSYTAPTEKTMSNVIGWLSDSKIKSVVDNDWITISTTVEKANALLNTTFAWYQLDGDDSPKLRTLEYSVPDDLFEDIDLIQPTTRFGQLAARRSTIFDTQILGPAEEIVKTEAAGAVCNANQITPDCIKQQYDIGYTASAEGNLVAFASYLEEYARYTDLQTFEKNWVPSAVGQNFSVVTTNGGLDSQTSNDDSGEANLDVQYILGVSHPIPIVEYSVGGRGPLVPTEDEPGPSSNEPYLEFLTYLLGLEDADLPQTLSTSYGEEEQSVPADYAIKVCNMFMQLGARGVSVLFSSGDSGPGDSCVRVTDDAPYFQPTFPGSCPYITSVGATVGVSPEKAVSYSSGGFSDLHARPSWQDDAVSFYLSSIGSTYSAYFNASGRGFPDVAALGTYFAVVDKGRSVLESGTSASAPTFAGVIALLNAARKEAGLAPLGFLNPWLYSDAADGLTDITEGYGSGCTSNSAFGGRGARWNATAGWDPVTGLGVPDFGTLLAVAAPGIDNA